jgi:hypothetical protein
MEDPVRQSNGPAAKGLAGNVLPKHGRAPSEYQMFSVDTYGAPLARELVRGGLSLGAKTQKPNTQPPEGLAETEGEHSG